MNPTRHDPDDTHELADIADCARALISEGLLKAGQTLNGRGRFSDVAATVLPDGSLQVGDKNFKSPSGAGRAVRKRRTNAWTFWQVDPGNGIRLDDLRSQYSVQLGIEADEMQSTLQLE